MRSRRGLLGAALAVLLVAPAGAETWPQRPVRWVVPYVAGGSTDVTARILAQPIGDALKQQVVIDNRAGAGGNIGVDLASKSAPDGYTMLFTTATVAINQTAYPKLSYDLRKDLVPVVLLSELPNAMVVPAALPERTVGEFIARAKAQPGTLNFGSGGNGTTPHAAGELFKLMTGIDMIHVPYKGDAPALQDLVAGQIQVMFAQLPGTIGHLRSGALRALAVTTPKRSAVLPDVPTVAESGVPGFEATSWYGIWVPAGTPAEIIERINRDANTVLRQPEVASRLLAVGNSALGGTPQDFARYLDSEIERWGKVVRAAKITID